MTMLVQNYLKTHSLAELKAAHFVNFRVHDHKVSLNYDTLFSDSHNPIACECRGLVLRHFHDVLTDDMIVGETKVFARTMSRFFNYGDPAAADIDFGKPSKLKFYEKHDGTMTALYWDSVKEDWCVATRSIPEANLPIDGFGDVTFAKLFELAFDESVGVPIDVHMNKINALDRDKTYIFELCTPANQIVVKHESYKIVLLAVRSNYCGTEHPIDNFKHLFPVCKTYSLKSFSDMVDFVSDRDPKQYEGIVVCDEKFNRVKVKNAEYMAISKVQDSIKSPRNVVNLYLSGHLDDVLCHIPDLQVERVMKIQEALKAVIPNFEKAYEDLSAKAKIEADKNGWDYRKALAIVSKESPYFQYVMARHNYGISGMDEYLDRMYDKSVARYNQNFVDLLLKLAEV